MSTRPAPRQTEPPPPAPAADPGPAADPAGEAAAAGQGRRVRGGLVGSLAALALLAAFAAAWVYPGLSPLVVAAALAAAAVALTGAARAGQAGLRADRERLAAENRRLTHQLEDLADTLWELRESEERYRHLVDAEGDLVVRRGADGRVTFVNPAFVRAFDRAPAAFVGKPLALAPPLAPVEGEVGDGGAGRDVRLVTAAGPRWYAWLDIAMRGEVYSVARDITARKAAEQALVDARQRAEAASRAKSRVLATVSHEFRTPLNGILGLAALLAETDLDADQATYLAAVQSSGEALLALVDDMLDFSRIEAGRLDLRPEPVDLESLLDGIADLLAARAHARGIDIAVDMAKDVPPAMTVDPVRLRQVLLNLAGNAVKFTEQGGVTISVVPNGENALAFAVADSGPGIPAGEAERLFHEFEQMDTAMTRRYGGAGLGLAIARRLVRLMGGDLRLAPGPDGGSVFSFTLALPATAATTATRPAVELAGRSFLVLAPAGAVAPAIVRRLADAGAMARNVRTLAEAAGLVGAAAAAGEPHDALLIDRRSVSDPADALARLREAAGRATPAAILIEPGGRAEIDRLRDAGFDAYLVRPVRRTSLLRIAAAIAGNRPAVFAADPVDERTAQRPVARRNGGGMDVLLAEDNEINALLARAVLEQLGHTVTEVHDGTAAVAAVRGRASPFGTILMDLHMPGLDGLSAAAAIREWEREAGWPRAAILAVTADVLPETRAAAAAAGIDTVVEKPMTPDILRRALAGIAVA